MSVTTKAMLAFSMMLFAMPLFVVGSSVRQSACYASEPAIDVEEADAAEDAHSPRERALMERITMLESNLTRQIESNATLAETIQSLSERIEAQDTQIRGMITDMAEANHQSNEMHEAMAEVSAQCERALNEVDSQKRRVAELTRERAQQRAFSRILSATMDAMKEQEATQATIIDDMITDLVEATQVTAELRQSVAQETAQRQRATNEAGRLREQLRACEAERDALAAELAALRADDE